MTLRPCRFRWRLGYSELGVIKITLSSESNAKTTLSSTPSFPSSCGLICKHISRPQGPSYPLSEIDIILTGHSFTCSSSRSLRLRSCDKRVNEESSCSHHATDARRTTTSITRPTMAPKVILPPSSVALQSVYTFPSTLRRNGPTLAQRSHQPLRRA